MSDGLTTDTAAVTQLAARMSALGDRLADPSDLLTDVGGMVARDANQSTPRATGALARSLRLTQGTIDGHPAQLLTWGVRYAVFVNFGTRYMPARPFATDALAAVTIKAEPALKAWAETQLATI